MRDTLVAAVVAPLLAVAGLWSLLTLDPVKPVRDRLAQMGANARTDSEVSNLYLDPATQESTRSAYPLSSLRRLETEWCGAADGTRYVLMGNSQTMAIVLAPAEMPVQYPEKTYPDLMLDALRSSHAPVQGYRLSAPNITYTEVLWYLTYLLSHRCATPTHLVLQLNFEEFRKTGGIRDAMLELLEDPVFAKAVDAEGARKTPQAALFTQAVARYQTRLASTTGENARSAQTSATGLAATRGPGAALETRVREVLDRAPAFRGRRRIKGELVNALYVARIRWLNITTHSRRSIAAATLSQNVSALERIGELCRMRGVTLILFNAPQNPLVPLYETDADRDTYHRVIDDIERRYASRAFDFENSIPKELWGVWIDGPDPIHLGRAGHRRLAELMLNAGVLPVK